MLAEKIALWVIQAQLPFITVESPEFLALVEYLNPSARVYKADTVRGKITKLYETCIEEVQREIKKYANERRFSSTTDVWTSPHNKVCLFY